jgi:hypothetical protein
VHRDSQTVTEPDLFDVEVLANGIELFADGRSYPIAGSFVAFLLGRFGVEALLDQCRGAARGDSLAVIRVRLVQVYGRSLEQLEAEWLAALGR